MITAENPATTNSNPHGRWLLRYATPITPSGMLVEIRQPLVVVGRRTTCDLVVQEPTVSARHALLVSKADGSLVVRDLDSTNGIYVNDERVQGERALQSGDTLQFGAVECTILYRGTEPESVYQTEPDETARQRRVLNQLLRGKGLAPVYQPIIDLESNAVVGYEVLARADLADCPSQPYELFTMAEKFGMESLMSHVFRWHAFEKLQDDQLRWRFFVNAHPSELSDDHLITSLQQVRERWPTLPLAAEIHESSMVAIATLRRIREALMAMNIEVVFDDFGVGQSRLLELVDVAPSMLKFDISLVRSLNNAPAPKRRLIESLVRLAHDQQIPVLAEGIETDAEAAICVDLGFDFAQGFRYGYPRPELLKKS